MICEVCKKEEAWALSHCNGGWILAGGCTTEREGYYILFAQIPAQDWLEHLQTKNWFNEKDFIKVLFRLTQKLIGESHGKTIHRD